jgi:hypothetical protein
MNKSNYMVTFDPTSQRTKPAKREFGAITNRMNVLTGVTINDFSTLVGSKHQYTWCGGKFEGGVNNSNWVSQEVFGLDFDNDTITVEEVYKILAEYNIIPQVWYSTLSSSEKHKKFRVILFLDIPITNLKLHKQITLGLCAMFPDSDQSCKNAGRLFLGGQQSHVTAEEPISTQLLLNVVSPYIITKYNSETRFISNLSYLHNNTLIEEKSNFLYNYNRNIHNSSKSQLPLLTTTIKGGNQASIDFKLARSKVKILDEFLNGKWLTHPELFGLSTNLIHIKGGRKLMKETMEFYNEEGLTEYTDNNFNILPYVSKVGYPAIPIGQFSKCPEDEGLYDIVSAARTVRGQIKIVAQKNTISLTQAELAFKEKFDDVISNGELGKVYLFSLPTAIGKTEILTSLENSIIASPTNDLKNEIATRMKTQHVVSPDQIIFEDDSLNVSIMYYYSIGLPQKAMEILYNIVSNGLMNYSTNDIQAAIDYIAKNETCKTADENIITTHRRALFGDYKHDTLVFDEDPLQSLLEIKNVRISDFIKLKTDNSRLQNSISTIIETLLSSEFQQVMQNPSFTIDTEDLINLAVSKDLNSNIFDFISSAYFLRDLNDADLIHYVVKRSLPETKKTIIMSATAPIEIYQKMLGDRLVVISLGEVEQIGKIIQYTKRSCSRNGLGQYINKISSEVGELPVITFRSFKSNFSNSVEEMHFGNCSGYDTLKGKDIAVVGTPHRNNIEYYLTGKALGIDFEIIQNGMSMNEISYNGFEFNFNCFNNEELRLIQLALIQSDLKQSVGRARTLRTNAIVKVYSNFPLRDADEFIY